MNRFRLRSLLAAALLAPSGVAAQASLDETLVFSPGRHAQSLGDVPVSVTVIDRAEIRAHGHRTLADVLRSVPGFVVRDDHNYENVGIRGLSYGDAGNARLLVMVDGRRTNLAITDWAALGAEGPVDLDVVERIEVMRGSGAALYGNNSSLGVVNIITRHGLAAGPAVVASGGAPGLAHGSVGVGFGAPGRGGYVAASGSRERGEDFVFPEFADVTDEVGTVAGLDRDRALNLFAKAGLGDVTVQAYATERRKLVPTGSYETTPGDARYFTRDWSLFGSVAYEHAFEDLSRVWASADYAFAGYDAEYPYGDIVNRDEMGGHSAGLESAYLRVLGAGHKVVVGGDVRRHFEEYQRNFDLPSEDGRGIAPGPDAVFLDEGYSSWAAGAFVQTELRLASAVRLSAGARYDWRESFGGAVSPRVALVLRPDPATSLRVGYGRTTRLPSVMERFYDDGGYSWKASDSLGAERIGTIEASIQRAFAGGWRASVTGYDLRATRQITQVVDPADGLLVYVNAGVIGSRGIELELERRIAGAATVRGSYAYQRARVDSSGTLPASPRHLAHLSAVAPIAGGRLSLAASARVIGARRTLVGNPLPATGVVGLGVTARPFAGRDIDLDLHVKNLFDNRYPDVATLDHLMEVLPQGGRRVTLGLRYRWR